MTSPGADRADLIGARIAVANWRDPWHPQAGGAERYAWEMARGLASRGAKIRFLTARAPGQGRRSRRDGIEIIRMGGRFTVYPLMLGWLAAHRRSFDAVLDCQNGIPFFTPLVLPATVPVLCVMHHVHSAQWDVHFPGWMARVGRLLEGPAWRLAYRRQACVAVSPSTVSAMRERLRWTGDIYVVPNGAPGPAPPPEPPERPERPGTAGKPGLVWVGRLVAHKRAELILPIAERLRGSGLTIDVVGRGPAAEALAERVTARGLAGTVRLRGFLPEQDKEALLAGSLLHLNTSQGEGFGLCVLEAAALGVPTVAFDVDGLRDAVRDGRTGWLVKDGERIEDVTLRAVHELADPARGRAIATACRSWAAQLDWDAAAARMATLIWACLQKGTSRASHPGAWIVSSSACAGRPAAIRGHGPGPGPAAEAAPSGELVLAGGPVVAEGPVLDILISQGTATLLRPATPLERLLGRPTAEAGRLR